MAAGTLHPMTCSLTAELCSFASQTALPHALPAVLSLLPHTTETAVACNERCPAGTHAMSVLACCSHSRSFSPAGTPRELQGQNHHPGFGEAPASFFPTVLLYSVLILFLETEADWSSSCTFCLKKKKQEFINRGTTC